VGGQAALQKPHDGGVVFYDQYQHIAGKYNAETRQAAGGSR
jgi:hypothetical protein